jgi:hypothetical protein
VDSVLVTITCDIIPWYGLGLMFFVVVL